MPSTPYKSSDPYGLAVLATMIETPAATAQTDNPPLLPHWKVSHPNGEVLVANTTRPLRDGVTALRSRGYAPDTSAMVELWINEEKNRAFEPMTIAQVLALP